ncbi:MAG TPA: response regulator [Pyrinomonadaceae bacterium]|nr:response regulator [Pyrinomonadaceae bacterium]
MTHGSTTVGLRPKSALVVEDNAQTQKVLNTLLKGAGFEVVTVSSLDEAIIASDRQIFEVAFVDMVLVEYDKNNRDGLAVLRHLNKKNEGTELVFLTLVGQFEDIDELNRDIRTLTAIRKGDKMIEAIRQVIERVRKKPPAARGFKNGSSVRVFSGHDGPGDWDTMAFKSLLKPSAGLLGMMGMLDEIAETCSPLLERRGDDGIQPTGEAGVMAGLYWSRGVGEAVVIALAKEKLPAELPRLDTWPSSLRTGETLYQVKRKNLVGAVVKCEGVEHTEFTVPRTPGE